MSDHLAVLLESDLVRAFRSGRHRYYAIASVEVASLIEAAGLLVRPSRAPDKGLRGSERARLEREARLCFNHLAGRIGVAFLRWLIDGDAMELRDDVAIVTPHGVAVFARLGATVTPGTAVPCCIDYSERAFHLRGPVAVAIARTWLKRKWLRYGPRRSLRLTRDGSEALREILNMVDLRLPGSE